MRKSKAARIAGFTVALGATASLAGFAATGTGAYFSDSKAGAAQVSTGDVKVNTTDISALDFKNLLPEQFKTQTVTYSANGTGPEDIYLAFTDPADAALNAPSAAGPTPLGRYGHLAVNAPAGSFSSFNLAANPSGPSGSCTVDGDGHGGSNQEATSTSDTTVPWCPAPQYILLQRNLQAGDGDQSATITFGFTKLLTSGQDSPVSSIPFHIVAEQAGVSPTDVNTTNTPAH